MIFILNGTIFLLIGLNLPVVVRGLQDISVGQAVGYGLIISVLLIVIRVIWTFTMAHLPRLLFKSIREKESSPGWKGPFVVSFAAMRGVVSLAAALSIPYLLPSHEPFPHRNLILFITFIIILVTLVGQGLALPWLIRLARISEFEDVRPNHEQEAEIEIHLKKASLKLLGDKHAEHLSRNQLVANLKSQLESDVRLTEQRLNSLDCQYSEWETYRLVLTDVLREQREELARLRGGMAYSDEVLRKHADQLDLDEARMHRGSD